MVDACASAIQLYFPPLPPGSEPYIISDSAVICCVTPMSLSFAAKAASSSTLFDIPGAVLVPQSMHANFQGLPSKLSCVHEFASLGRAVQRRTSRQA